MSKVVTKRTTGKRALDLEKLQRVDKLIRKAQWQAIDAFQAEVRARIEAEGGEWSWGRAIDPKDRFLMAATAWHHLNEVLDALGLATPMERCSVANMKELRKPRTPKRATVIDFAERAASIRARRLREQREAL